MARNNRKDRLTKPEDLRQQAERKLPRDERPLAEMSSADVEAMVHELEVHQIELSMQNEELRRVQVELEQSRTKYADLFDFAPIGYLVLDANGLVLEANLTATAMLGVDRNRLTGAPFTLHVAPTARDSWRFHHAAAFKTAREQQIEIELLREDRSPMTVRLRSRPVTDKDGHIVECRTAMTNITALVRTEQRLRESERRFRTLAENAPDVIARIGRDMRILYVNKPVENALGAPPEEFIGRTFEEVGVPEEASTRWTEAIVRVFATGKPDQVDFDCSMQHLVRHYSAAIVPEFNEDRSIDTVIVTVRDVTRRVETEEKYTAVIHSLQDGFCILDAQGQYLEVNDTCCRMLGRTREELLQLNVRDVWEPEQQQQVLAHLHQALQDGYGRFEMQHRRRDSGRLDCDVTIQRLDHDRFFVFARDVTEHRRSEAQRMETLQRLALVARATDDAIWDWNIEADTFWHNETYATMFGYAPEELGSSNEWWRENIHPEDRKAVLASIDAVLHDGTDQWSARYRFRRKDGSYIWIMDRGMVVRDGQGKPTRMIGAMIDLTEKLGLLDQLESERAKFATILDTALSGIIVVDEQARITYANPMAQRLYQRPIPYGEDVETHRRFELCYPDGQPYEPCELPLARSALAGETYTEVEMVIRWPDGQQRWLLANTSPLQNAGGEHVGAVAVVQDITDLKTAEAALRLAHDRLEERVRERTIELDNTINTLHEEVAEKIEVQGQLMHQNEMLQKIIDNIPVMLLFYDFEGNIALINEEFGRVLGYSLEELQQNGFMTLCFPDSPYRHEVWEHMMAATPGWRDFLVRRKDGGKVTSSWANVRLSDGSYLGIAIDIRERKRFENRLRESEERYRTLVELSPDAIGVERDGVIQFVNSTAVRLLGAQTPDDLVGRLILDFVHTEYRDRADRQFKYLRKKRRPLPITEEKIIRLDGMVVDVELAAMPIAFENKPANQIVLRDITQRKQVEARLHENARQLQQQAELLDLAHDSIVVNDMDGRIVFWNRGAEQTYGWKREEAIGKISHDLLKTRFPANLIEISARLLSQGRWNGEIAHTTREGETIVVSSRWALQRDEDGRPTGILVIDRDVTQQKHAEQAMIEARRFAESITNTVQESLLVLDRDLRVVSANQTFYQTFRVAPEDTEGRYIFEIGQQQWGIPELRRLLEDILPHDTSFENFEVEHDFTHLGRRTMMLNARRIYQEAQGTETILLAIQDVTLRKEQEQKIREHQQQLAALTEDLLLAEERERHRIALVLHDSIGQSLSFSKRELGVLQKNAPDPLRSALEYVKTQIDDAVRQTRSLTFELSPTTLHTFGLEAAVEELAEQFAERGEFQYQFEATEEDKPLTEQMRALLYRAARELLMNVVKHAEAPSVSIHIDRIDRSLRLVIEDDGRGFDISRLEQVVRQQEGFGLFSIRERLTHVGGTFDIESEPGKGTRVTLTAPLHLNDQGQSRSGKS